MLIEHEKLNNIHAFELVGNGIELDVMKCALEMESLQLMLMEGPLDALRNKYKHSSMACIHPLIGLVVKYPSSEGFN